MSSDSDHTPKPTRRIRCYISDSESSDDSDVIKISRKTRKVLSDNSDEDEVVQKGKSIKRKNMESDDEENSSCSESEFSSTYVESDTTSEWESDWESSEESDSVCEKSSPVTKKLKKTKKPATTSLQGDAESDESDGQSEKCPICLLSFRNQQIATPSSCDHCFCLLCLTEWTKNVNTCPVDRQEFTVIRVKARIDGEVIKTINIEARNNTEDQIQEDPTYCEVCHLCDREDRMLLCDGCDLGYHLECLTPPMSQVPIEEWYCLECSQNNQTLAESVEIDVDELPDIMAEARFLGITYGRTRIASPMPASPSGYLNVYLNRPSHVQQQRHRLIPRTRQSERVRANVRADRNRTRSARVTQQPILDPDQPSTSSGFDSISENSRASGTLRFRRTVTKSKNRKTSRKKKARKTKKKINDNSPILQKVHIKEYNTDGEEQEIVTYVKVKSQSTSRKRKKRTVKSRKKRKTKSTRHKIYCRLDNIKTVKKRLAYELNKTRKLGGVNTTGFNITNQLPIAQQHSELSYARYRAGIPQLNLYGNNLNLDYSPSASDEEITSERQESGGVNGGTIVGIRHRGLSSIHAIRRRLGLKSARSFVNVSDTPQPTTDLLTNIINSQNFWHSKEKKITLKADGTLIIPEKNGEIIKRNDAVPNNNNNNNDNNSYSNNNSEFTNNTKVDNSNDSTNINSTDIVQAPLYNNSRGRGSNNSDSGAFRGNYYNRSHNNPNNRNDYNIRDSYSSGGQQNYGGHGPRDNSNYGEFRPPPSSINDFRQNFDSRRQPPTPGIPPFRNRNNFRNNNVRQRRFNADRPVQPSQPPFRPPNPSQNLNNSQTNNTVLPPVSNISNDVTPSDSSSVQVPSSTPTSSSSASASINVNSSEIEQETQNVVDSSSTINESTTSESVTAVTASDQPADSEECDIYDDMELPSDKSSDLTKQNCDNDGELMVALMPPPVPPSDLLDFEDNMKSDNENESDENDLVIDDAPKPESADGDGQELKSDDKYDPFSVDDSDSNDSHHKEKDNKADNNNAVNSGNISIPTLPLEPPPMPPDLPSIDCGSHANQVHIDMDASDDENDDNSKSDCPNFSIYSSETMDVARHAEQELTQQIGPLEPPPLPPDIPDDDDIIVADVQACDLTDIPEPSDPYIESLQKERQTLNKIPPKKLSIDSRGKITFKIGNKFKLNNKLYNLRDELDDNDNDTPITTDKESKDNSNKRSEQESTSNNVEMICTESKSYDKSNSDNHNKRNCEATIVDSSVLPIDDTTCSNNNNENGTKRVETDSDDGNTSNLDVIVIKNDDVKNDDGDDNEGSVDINIIGNKANEEIKNDDENFNDNEEEKLKDDDDEKIDVNKNDTENISISHTPDHSDIELEKEKPKSILSLQINDITDSDKNADDHWDSDGNYTPCKDEMPTIIDKDDDKSNNGQASPYDSGLEPITPPTKDRSTDDLDVSCTTPIDYAGLGTEAISETDEPINFEDELVTLSERNELDIKDSNTVDENNLSCKNQSGSLSDTENSDNHKKKRDKKEKCKDTEKNKENISSENHVAWKKISKNTKERSYREKGKHDSNDKEKDKDTYKDRDKFSKDKGKHRAKSKEKIKKKTKDEIDRKKVKRKELPRYDVRKIVAEKPRPRKDEYGRDIRGLSRSLSRSRSLVKNTSKHSHSRERMSRSYSPRVNLRSSRSWSRNYQRSWSQNRSSPSYNKSSGSRLRKKSPVRDRRSLSRRRSRSPTNRRSRRSSSNQRNPRRNKKKSIPRKHRSRSRSWSRSRSRSRQRSRTRTRSRSRSRTRSRLRLRSRSKSRSKSRSRSRARKKDKTKTKRKSRSHSRRRNKRSRSKSPPVSSNKLLSKALSKKRSKRKSNTTNTNVSHSFSGRSRSHERSYSRERNHNRNWSKVNEKTLDSSPFSLRADKDQIAATAPASWSAQWTPSWSRSRSRTPIDKQRNDHIIQSHGWSPSSSIGELAASQADLALPPSSPPSQSSILINSLGNTANIGGSSAVVSNSAGQPLDDVVSPKNLTVILRNKDATKNKKKKEKRREAKERKKSRELESRRKSSSKRNRTPPPSKEVFASGDNILVSVCFNNDNLTIGQSNSLPTITDSLPLLTTTKRRRREPIPDEQLSKKPKKDKNKEKRSRSPRLNKRDKKRKSKAAEIAASKKPVAVIDLDQSPFREQTLSPQDVIILSDDDNGNTNDRNENINSNKNDDRNTNVNTNNINSSNSINNSTNNCLSNSTNIGENNSHNHSNSKDNNNDNMLMTKGGKKSSDYDDDDDEDADDDQSSFSFAVQQGDMNMQLNKGDDKNLQSQDHQQQIFTQQQLFKQQMQQKRSISSELDQFIMQGPKTPPEPQVKFCINKQSSSMRPIIMHPLFDIDQDDEMMEVDERMNTNIRSGKAVRAAKEKGGEIDMFEDDDEIERSVDITVNEMNNLLLRKDQDLDRDKNEDLDNLEENDRQDGKKDTKVQRDTLVDDEEINDDDEDVNDRLQVGIEEGEDEMMLENEDKRTMGDNNRDKDDDKKRKDTEIVEHDRECGDKKVLKNDNKNSEPMEGGKIGPNTPPEPPISPLESPDAYDPFDPTKSRSQTPSVIEESHLGSDQKHNEGNLMSNNDKSDSDKPKVISMVTIKRASSPDKNIVSPMKPHVLGVDSTKTLDNQLFKDHTNQLPVSSSSLNCFTTINPVLATVAAAVQRSGIFNLNNPPPFNVTAPRNTCQMNRQSPSGQLKQQRNNDRNPQLSNVFVNAVKNLPVSTRNSKLTVGRNSSMLVNNNSSDLAIDTSGINDTSIIDTSSPYSPGSSLSDGIFDPPSPGRNHHSPTRLSSTNVTKNVSSNSVNNMSKIRSSVEKKDAFDALFGSSTPPPKVGASKLRTKKSADSSNNKKKKSTNSKVGVRMDENQLQILDDLPSSAVEMQVKDKFLKKLNRQERVVEEVKLVLKPHYTKKHVTKEEYKDIMRKAVPKICHNKTGEINPKKIAQLIEAYVKRCRSNKRKNASAVELVGKSTSTAKTLRPSKNIWS